MSIGQRIRKVREDADLSMEKFGQRIGIARSSLSLLESGKNNPSERTLKLICSEFNVNYIWLTRGEGEMYSNVGNTILGMLAKEYHLSDLDKLILERYLMLPDEQKAGIRAFAQSLIDASNEKKRDL